MKTADGHTAAAKNCASSIAASVYIRVLALDARWLLLGLLRSFQIG